MYYSSYHLGSFWKPPTDFEPEVISTISAREIDGVTDGTQQRMKTSRCLKKRNRIVKKGKKITNALWLPVAGCTNTLQAAFHRRKGGLKRKTERERKAIIISQYCRFSVTESVVVPVGPWEHSNDFNEEDLLLIEIRFLFYLAATSRIL